MTYFTNQEINDFADGRNTSNEICEAILKIATNNEDAARIWQDPTESEMLAIWERVTKNGLLAADDFCWGAAGSSWAVEAGFN